MKTRQTDEVALIRELLAAIDNAEAVPRRDENASLVRHQFQSGSAEGKRLVLSETDVRELLLREIDDREQAATDLDRLGETERAEAFRAKALIAKRYLD